MDAALGQQGLHQRGLLSERVMVRPRLGREAEPQEVRGDCAKARGQVRPEAVPVPRRRGKTVEAEQGRTCAVVMVEDVVLLETKRVSGAVPRIKGHRRAVAGKVGPPNVARTAPLKQLSGFWR